MTTLEFLRRKPLKNNGPHTFVVVVVVSQESIGDTVLSQGTVKLTLLVGPRGLPRVSSHSVNVTEYVFWEGWATAVKSKM
jgi:hypothetical protein